MFCTILLLLCVSFSFLLLILCDEQIADGMTLEVRTVNLLLETHGGARRQGGATWYLSEPF